MSAPSLAPFILKRPWLQKWVQPLANWYVNAAGYRQLGLRYDPHQTNALRMRWRRIHLVCRRVSLMY
jgi:ubiquinol-cytochrome c reductase subunit 7